MTIWRTSDTEKKKQILAIAFSFYIDIRELPYVVWILDVPPPKICQYLECLK